MLQENIKRLRQARGLTQEELASRLNVVRQTVSKWEKGLSVPDSEMLVELSEQLDAPVSALLGETVELPENGDELRILSDKLAALNEQLAKGAERRRRLLRGASLAGFFAAALYLAGLAARYLPPLYGQNAGSAVIGGADGPTSILIMPTGSSVLGAAVAAAVLLACVCGVCLTGKK